jgi:aspartyl-tRNA(Asn)/glutamyl-tRNA(Gln) amidotransferase subunit B
VSAAAYEVVIGLEVHAHLSTKSKIFSWSSAAFGADPNAEVDPVSLGLPGTLPVLNRAVVEAAVRLGLAAGSKIRTPCRFARKHYFYPDMPKNFQISQYDEPICEGGAVAGVKLTRIHLEEDAGKLVHAAGGKSWVDYNRAGVGLCEIVSEPDIRSAEQAADYVRAIRELVRALEIGDGNMEEGSLRCDANVSLHKLGTPFGTKVEIKNLNSFKNLRDSIEHEVKRQAALLDRGERVVQETRLWDTERGVTQAMRSKEQAHDYRYFPEPDLPPLVVDQAWLTALRATIPELREARLARYQKLGLSAEVMAVLGERREIASYFDAAVAADIKSAGVADPPPKRIANLLVNEVLGLYDDPSKLQARDLKLLAAHAEAGTISSKQTKEILAKLAAEGGSVEALVKAGGLAQVSDSGALEEACRRVVDAHPDEAARFREGNAKLMGFFVGAVMKETGGKANPKAVNEILRRLLGGG